MFVVTWNYKSFTEKAVFAHKKIAERFAYGLSLFTLDIDTIELTEEQIVSAADALAILHGYQDDHNDYSDEVDKVWYTDLENIMKGDY